MKILKKLVPLTIAALTVLTLTGCEEKEESTKKSTTHEKNPIATMQVEYDNAQGKTKQGTIKIELYPNDAPITVANFVNLAQNGFYDGLTFHRIIEDFMIQGGDPSGNGSGSAKVSDIDKTVEKDSDDDYAYSIKGEFSNNNIENKIEFEAGTIAMARSDYSQLGLAEEGYNSGCSQFFIMNTDDSSTCEYLQGNYAAFGKVTEGYDVVLDISKTKIQENEQSGEMSSPEKAPVIKSLTVDTFGEEYDIPKLINADETMEKVNQVYMQLLQQYYGINSDSDSSNE